MLPLTPQRPFNFGFSILDFGLTAPLPFTIQNPQSKIQTGDPTGNRTPASGLKAQRPATRRSRIDAPLHPSPTEGSKQWNANRMTRAAYAKRCCLCHSPTLRPWIAPPPAARARVMVVLRGGALEPDRAGLPGNRHAKAHAISQRDFQADAQRIFLSQAGPQFLRWLLKLGITLLSRNLDSPPK